MRFRKAFEFTNSALFRLEEPVIQVPGTVLGQHRNECLREVVGGLQIRVSRAELFDERSLLLVEFVWLAHT